MENLERQNLEPGKMSEEEQQERLKELNDFRDRWLIARELDSALKARKYKFIAANGEKFTTKKAIEARKQALSDSIVKIAKAMVGEDFISKAKADSGYDKNKRKKSEYQKLLTQRAKDIFYQKQKELEFGSGKIAVGPKGREKLKELRARRVQEQIGMPAEPEQSVAQNEAKEEVERLGVDVEELPEESENTAEPIAEPGLQIEQEKTTQQKIEEFCGEEIEEYEGSSQEPLFGETEHLEYLKKLLDNAKRHDFFEPIEVGGEQERSVYEHLKYLRNLEKRELKKATGTEGAEWIYDFSLKEYEKYDKFVKYIEGLHPELIPETEETEEQAAEKEDQYQGYYFAKTGLLYSINEAEKPYVKNGSAGTRKWYEERAEESKLKLEELDSNPKNQEFKKRFEKEERLRQKREAWHTEHPRPQPLETQPEEPEKDELKDELIDLDDIDEDLGGQNLPQPNEEAKSQKKKKWWQLWK